MAAYLYRNAPLDLGATFYLGVRNELLPAATRADDAPPSDVRPILDEKSAIDLVRTELRRAIATAIGPAKRVAVHASGGLDSSTLLALTLDLQRERGGSAFAIAIDFGGPGSDDQRHLRALQAYLGCEVVRIAPAAGASFADVLRNGVDAAPVLWPLATTQLAVLAAAKAHGADVTITGVGGDDFFDGSPSALASLALRQPVRAWKAFAHLDGWGDVSWFDGLVRPTLKRLVPKRVRALRARRRPSTPTWAGPVLRDVRTKLVARDTERALGGDLSPLAQLESPVFRYFAWQVHQEQRTGLLERFDPILTHRVAFQVGRIAPHLLLAGNVRRGLLRAGMRSALPDSLLDRLDKSEFTVAFSELFASLGGVGAFREELDARMLRRLGIVEGGSFRDAATNALENPDDTAAYALPWAALAAEAFLLRHPHLT